MRNGKSAFRPCGRDLVEFFNNTGWAFYFQGAVPMRLADLSLPTADHTDRITSGPPTIHRQSLHPQRIDERQNAAPHVRLTRYRGRLRVLIKKATTITSNDSPIERSLLAG